jgi:hypothetical protein
MSTKNVKQKSKSPKQVTSCGDRLKQPAPFSSLHFIYFSRGFILLLTSLYKINISIVYLIESGRGTGPVKPRQPFRNERGANSSG